MNFDRLTQYLDKLDDWNIPARDLIITKDGQQVYRHFSGCHDEAGLCPMDGKEVYWIYSMTKPMTMACVLKLMQEGKLRLEDPVCRYLPAFSHHPDMTVEHLMSMRGGLDYDLNFPGRAECGPEADTLTLVNALAKKPLQFEPGTDFQYSLCHDVAAAVVEVVSGMRFSAYMKDNFIDPLGMVNTGFYLTDYHKAHMCAQYERIPDSDENRKIPDFENIYRLTEHYESGGAGLITTAEDYIRFSTAMANGEILTPETVDIWRGRSLKGKAKASFDLFQRWGYNYALGVRVMEECRYSKGPNGEFGWDGAAGAYTLIDPENRLALVYMMHVKGCGPAYSDVHPTIRDLTYEAIKA